MDLNEMKRKYDILALKYRRKADTAYPHSAAALALDNEISEMLKMR